MKSVSLFFAVMLGSVAAFAGGGGVASSTVVYNCGNQDEYRVILDETGLFTPMADKLSVNSRDISSNGGTDQINFKQEIYDGGDLIKVVKIATSQCDSADVRLQTDVGIPNHNLFNSSRIHCSARD